MDRKRAASAVSGGIFVICLGILLYTGWWWPGIMVAIGLSGGAELIFRGKILQGIGTLVFFCAIPFFISVVQRVEIPWTAVGALFLIGMGAITIVKAFILPGD